MENKLSLKQKNIVFFGIALCFTILFLGLTFGLAFRPYSTIMPYQIKHESIMAKAFLEDNQIIIKIKGEEDQIVQYDYKDTLKENVTAFKINHVSAKIGGQYLDCEMKNLGNFICVFLFAFLTLFGIGASVYTGINAFHKKL